MTEVFFFFLKGWDQVIAAVVTYKGLSVGVKMRTGIMDRKE